MSKPDYSLLWYLSEVIEAVLNALAFLVSLEIELSLLLIRSKIKLFKSVTSQASAVPSGGNF